MVVWACYCYQIGKMRIDGNLLCLCLTWEWNLVKSFFHNWHWNEQEDLEGKKQNERKILIWTCQVWPLRHVFEHMSDSVMDIEGAHTHIITHRIGAISWQDYSSSWIKGMNSAIRRIIFMNGHWDCEMDFSFNLIKSPSAIRAGCCSKLSAKTHNTTQ